MMDGPNNGHTIALWFIGRYDDHYLSLGTHCTGRLVIRYNYTGWWVFDPGNWAYLSELYATPSKILRYLEQMNAHHLLTEVCYG